MHSPWPGDTFDWGYESYDYFSIAHRYTLDPLDATKKLSSSPPVHQPQTNHVDLSCSAFGGISTRCMNIGQDGWLNIDVQRVDCSIGLGPHPL